MGFVTKRRKRRFAKLLAVVPELSSIINVPFFLSMTPTPPLSRTFAEFPHAQIADLTPDQLLLSLGLRSIMRQRGLDPQEDDALKQALPSFLRHASVVRAGKIQVRVVGGWTRARALILPSGRNCDEPLD